MNTLPTHGRINCSRCFSNGVVEFDKSLYMRGDWRITANPMAWGNSEAKVVVLGFSKGPTQAGALASAPHEDVAYKGSRTNVSKILEYIGVLTLSHGESASEAVSKAIADKSGLFHFGSLIRCTVERFERKGAAWKGSGGGMLDKFISTEFGRSVASNCVKQHLTNLPSTTQLVVMFGMGQKLNYVESAFELYKSARGGQWRRINEVAYTDGKIVIVHVEHFASQGKYIPQWLDATSKRGRYGVMAKEAVALTLKGVGFNHVSGGGKATPVDAPRATLKKARVAEHVVVPTAPKLENVSDAFSRRFSFLLKNGTEVFPVRMKNQQTGEIAFRVSQGGAGGNTKKSGIEVQDEAEMMHYVLELGYSVRASSLSKNKASLYKANGRAVAEVRMSKV